MSIGPVRLTARVAFPDIERHIGDGGIAAVDARQDAGAVDQNVDPPKVALDCGDRLLDRLRIGHVQPVAARIDAACAKAGSAFPPRLPG